MKKWLCIICGWVYDEKLGWPADGIAPGTKWEDVPDDWLCPDCLVTKADFEMIEIFDEEEDDSPSPVITPNKPEPIVIIGSGHAGYQLATALRRASSDLPITIFTSDNGAIYNKPALSNALALGKTSESLVLEHALDWENRLNIRLYPNTLVESIDRKNRKIYTDIGEYPYGNLVLATGASPISVPINGDSSDVISVNNLSDYETFRQKLLNKEHITILGDGLIGCEFANDLSAQGFKVNVVGLGQWAMQKMLPEKIAIALQQALHHLGVEWMLQTSIDKIESVGSHYRVTLQNGEQFETDLILSAIGLKPNIKLAQEAGIKSNIGIMTDLNHRSSDPHIFALGDCAEVDGQWSPYIAPINQALPTLVNTLLGKPMSAKLSLTPIIVKTPIMPLSILPTTDTGHWEIIPQDNEWLAKFYNQQGYMTGFILLGKNLQQQRTHWLQQLQ